MKKWLQTRLAVLSAITANDAGARHRGKNGYTTHSGNDFFAWFESTEQKNRVNFLRLLRAGRSDAWLIEALRRALAESALTGGLIRRKFAAKATIFLTKPCG